MIHSKLVILTRQVCAYLINQLFVKTAPIIITAIPNRSTKAFPDSPHMEISNRDYFNWIGSEIGMGRHCGNGLLPSAPGQIFIRSKNIQKNGSIISTVLEKRILLGRAFLFRTCELHAFNSLRGSMLVRFFCLGAAVCRYTFFNKHAYKKRCIWRTLHPRTYVVWIMNAGCLHYCIKNFIIIHFAGLALRINQKTYNKEMGNYKRVSFRW